MILTVEDLRNKFSDYIDIKGKIRREVAKSNLFPLGKGLYETDKNISGKYLAGYIYGPSYLSFDYALYLYGLIPEAVYNTFTSATFNKRKRKEYSNYFGLFVYRDVPTEVFSLGVKVYVENGYSYQLATPEKALCDKLYTLSPVQSIKALRDTLFEDLRIDVNEFEKLNKQDICELASLYHSTNLDLLAKLVKGE